MSKSLPEKYAQLSRDLKYSNDKLSSSGTLALFCFLVGSIFGILLTSSPPAPSGMILDIPLMIKIGSGIATLVLGIGVYVSFRNGKSRRPDSRFFPAIITFNAYKAVSDLLVTEGLHQRERKDAKLSLVALYRHVSGWKTVRTPELISKPINSLAKGIKNKLIPIAVRGERAQIESVQKVLFELLEALDRDLKWDELNDIGPQIEKLPTITLQRNPVIEFLKNNELTTPISVGIVVGTIIAVIVYFADGNVGSAIGVGSAVAVGVIAIAERRIKKS